MNTQLAARIRHARKRAKLTQMDVAASLGLATASVGQWEVGRSSPSSTNLRKLAALLGVPLEWLGSDESTLEEIDGPLMYRDEGGGFVYSGDGPLARRAWSKREAAQLALSDEEREFVRVLRRVPAELRPAALAAVKALAAQSSAQSRKKSAS